MDTSTTEPQAIAGGEQPKKRTSRIKVILVLLLFVALFVLFTLPSRHIFNIDDDSYIAKMEQNFVHLWTTSPLSQPLHFLYNKVFNNDMFGGLLQNIQNGKLPEFNMPTLQAPTVGMPVTESSNLTPPTSGATAHP